MKTSFTLATLLTFAAFLPLQAVPVTYFIDGSFDEITSAGTNNVGQGGAILGSFTIDTSDSTVTAFDIDTIMPATNFPAYAGDYDDALLGRPIDATGQTSVFLANSNRIILDFRFGGQTGTPLLYRRLRLDLTLQAGSTFGDTDITFDAVETLITPNGSVGENVSAQVLQSGPLDASVVPEPANLSVLLAAALGAFTIARRRRR